MDVVSLSSGSKGNSTYLRINETDMLIDVGPSMKQINNRLLMSVGIDLEDIKLIFITHEHSDHIRSIPTINKKYPHIKFVIHKDSINEIIKRLKYSIPNDNKIIIDNELIGDSFTVKVTSLNHDVPCFGYKFINNYYNESYGHIADNGGIPYKKWDWWKGLTYYSVESNHDRTMQLLDTKRDGKLKRRVLGYYGHTNNYDAIKMLVEIVNYNTNGVIFTHLSEDCNSEEVAREVHDTYLTVFGERTKFKDIKLLYARQNEPVELIIDK